MRLPLVLLMLMSTISCAEVNAVNANPDLDRPIYHYMPPKNWMNDPKPFFHKGEYHIFHQYNPHDAVWGPMHWGHAVSTDLVRWKRLPIALAPTPDSPDKDGCWTGCVVEKDGLFHILYTGVDPQTQCLATSRDLITWEKHKGNPVIAAPPEGVGDCWRDPCAWKEDGDWYAIIGSEKRDVGGAALLYRSKDLIHWDYMHPLFIGDKSRDGAMFECPDFFPLGGKHVLITSCGRTFWNIGRYVDHKFVCEKSGLTDGGQFYAAKTLIDDEKRRILWGWLQEPRSPEEMRAAGWSGALSLPRVLSLRADGTLGMAPPPELKALRGKHYPSRSVAAGEAVSLIDDIRGGALEITARIKVDGFGRAGLVLRATPDLSEGLYLWVDAKEKLLSAAGGRLPDPSVRREQIAFDPSDGAEIELRIYLDHSVLEVFADGRACLTARHYTKRADADRVGLFAVGGSAKCIIEAWEMKGIW